MGVGKPEGKYGDIDKLYFVKLVGLKQGATSIYFECKYKDGEEYKEVLMSDGTHPTTLSGDLVDIEYGEHTPEGTTDTYRFMTLTFRDGRDVYVLKLGFSNAANSLFNSMLGWEGSFDDVQLNVNFYNDYPAIWLQIQGEKSKWKHDYKTVIEPKVKKIDIGGGKVAINKDELIEFLKTELETQIKPKLKGLEGSQKDVPEAELVAEPVEARPEGTPPPVADPTDDDLPF